MPEIGSVSHGTMREEDLIPAFMSALDDILNERITSGKDSPEEVAEVGALHDKLGVIERRMEAPGYYDSEEAGWDLDWLFDTLDEHAPEGCYFGAIEGDGSDYGFWRDIEDDYQQDEPIDWREQDEWAAQSERIQNIRDEY